MKRFLISLIVISSLVVGVYFCFFYSSVNHEFDEGSRIDKIELVDQKTNDLVLLGQIWGFLKYYHPAVCRGEYNWDYELFRILPEILDSKNPVNRDEILLDWIKNLGDVKPQKVKTSTKHEVKLLPDFSWMKKKSISDELIDQLLLIKNAERTDSSYYIGLYKDTGIPKFKHEDAYASMKCPDVGFRILCLYRYWNIIQYYFPYKYLIGEDWNNVLREFVPKFVNANSEYNYQLTVIALLAKVHDTHATTYSCQKAIYDYYGNYLPPLKVTFVEDKVLVIDYLNEEAGKASGLIKGDIIEKINGKPINEIIKERLPLTPASNYPTQLRKIAPDLLRSNKKTVSIEFRRNDSIFKVTVEAKPAWFRNHVNRPDTCFKWLPDSIAYLYMGTLKEEYVKNEFSKIGSPKGLIIDFRCYPACAILYLLEHGLMPEPKEFVKFTMPSIKQPGLFEFLDSYTIGKKNENYYKGKIVIIVNEETQSAAEFYSMGLRIAPKAIVIGSTTAGADGNAPPILLPGDIETYISGIGVYYPDGKETQRIGIVPDIVVKPTIQGIKEGRDELLEKAVELINEK
ncbi:MAG TPA: S41 family peptidase [Flavobacteriales bacterium]|nr:S41 family peptidase [Flavobacteriales bacterium]